MFDHEGHELGWVSSDIEELEIIFLDKFLKGRVGSYADSMTVCFLEDFSQGDKRLDITSRTDDLDDNVELGRRGLAGETTETGRDVGGREILRLRFDRDLALDSRGKKIG